MKNKEPLILAVVVFFTLVTYYLVEPFAHSQMHKHVEGQDFVYNGTADIEEVEHRIAIAKEGKADTKALEAKLQKKKAFWSDVEKISKLKGDVVAGEGTFAMCQGCHMEGAANMGGVTPPSLAHSGALYDTKYLIALIKDPAMASNVDHKYADTSMHPMGSIMAMVSEPQDIANVVAFLKAKKSGEVTPKEAFVDSCGRCHANRYEQLTQSGFIPKTKADIKTGTDIAMLDFKKKVAQEQISLAGYLGKLPPDLSIIIRARSEHFLETFVENPQSQLAGTAMPRVGLTKDSYAKVLEYLEDSGDTKRHERESVGKNVMIYILIFAIFALLWKREIWRDLH